SDRLSGQPAGQTSDILAAGARPDPMTRAGFECGQKPVGIGAAWTAEEDQVTAGWYGPLTQTARLGWPGHEQDEPVGLSHARLRPVAGRIRGLRSEKHVIVEVLDPIQKLGERHAGIRARTGRGGSRRPDYPGQLSKLLLEQCLDPKLGRFWVQAHDGDRHRWPLTSGSR